MSLLAANPPALYHLRGFHEPFSAFSHLLGAALFLVLGFFLLRRSSGSRGRRIYLGIYVFSGVLLMTMSGVYHMMITGGAASQVMIRLDHSAIFILIAGTFTPIHGLLFRGPLRWLPLTVIWLAAVAGVVLKTVYFDTVAEWVSLSLYLAMGWFGVFAGVLLWRRYGFAFVRPMLLGGIAYSIGAVLEFCRWPVVIPGVIHAHDIFHVAVLIGAAFHFALIWRIADISDIPQPNSRDTAVAPPIALAPALAGP